jgi:hypothetical protein
MMAAACCSVGVERFFSKTVGRQMSIIIMMLGAEVAFSSPPSSSALWQLNKLAVPLSGGPYIQNFQQVRCINTNVMHWKKQGSQQGKQPELV